MVRGAIAEGLIGDEDFATVPEVTPFFSRLAGELRDDLYHYHSQIKKQIQLPIVQNCFCYSFAKGVESAYLWKRAQMAK